jgi:hypothetical protein
MDHKQGEVIKEINGKPYTFKYGMASSLILSRKVDITKVSNNPIEFIAYLFWAGLMTRAEKNGLSDKFTVEEAADLVDDMTQEDASEVYDIAIESFGFIGKLAELQEEKKARTKNHQPSPA